MVCVFRECRGWAWGLRLELRGFVGVVHGFGTHLTSFHCSCHLEQMSEIFNSAGVVLCYRRRQ